MRETLSEEFIPKLKEATAQEVESGQRFKTFWPQSMVRHIFYTGK